MNSPIPTTERSVMIELLDKFLSYLSEYHQLEFALFPDSYSWTLVHTHEDDAFGGPYFIRTEDLQTPNHDAKMR